MATKHPAPPAPRDSRRAERGVTLIEILAAFVILSIIALAMGSMVTAGYTTAERTRNLATARVAAEEVLDQLIEYSYVKGQEPTVAVPLYAATISPAGVGFDVGTGFYALRPIAGNSKPGRIVTNVVRNVVEVYVIIEWTDGLGDNAVQLVTHLTKTDYE